MPHSLSKYLQAVFLRILCTAILSQRSKGEGTEEKREERKGRGKASEVKERGKRKQTRRKSRGKEEEMKMTLGGKKRQKERKIQHNFICCDLVLVRLALQKPSLFIARN